ncbi:TraG family conjugative transposon ATPase [Chitinophaga sancti]|uniref:Bacteroides conjugation system ATPase, TraG family n=1 Tax=Chitinophaga sancti TaxID=1004 RepID=A0A1K1T020_9BACT|nr:TraG family conjugative transposon ATPase [Chitinophaga sancti]WQD65372.1 TraG family conjugative transposon ATPase [Chitinophaga sancti]WQG89004.1 TraG family conjugative transposon ATPase [Chitinophaga sancti]SFW89844.1 Bacteroides conjugation system ATPase, TraG family [Chitinophaga sancti]
MEKVLDKILPIMGVENDCIVSKQGDITVAYRVILPEIFTLGNDDYENLHQTWNKAMRVLPKHTVLHKQDWFTESVYQPENDGEEKSFLRKSADRHFRGRKFLDHRCYLYLTKKPAGRKPSSSVFSNLIRTSLVPEQTVNPILFQDFLDSCGQFKQIMQDSGLLTLEQLSDNELTSDKGRPGVIEEYCFLADSPDSTIVKDISFDESIKVGEKFVQIYTLGDVDDVPAMCGSRINYEKYSTDRTKFSIGFASAIGQLLPCNHIYNQFIFIEDSQKTIQQLEKKRLRLQSLAGYSRENAISRDAVNDFLNEAVSEQRLPVRAHFNVMVWTTEKAELKDLKNKVSAALAQMDAGAKLETVGAAQIFWAGIPGNASDFPMNDTFQTFAAQASCFLNNEGAPKSVPEKEGIRFSDRLTNRPVFVDPFDRPRKLGISSNMGVLCCGTSGGGKSMTINHVLQTMYDQGAHVVIVDIGGSYQALCELVGGYYFTYTEQNPIKFNPFFLPDGPVLDTEKKESLKSLLISLWKQDNENFNRSEYVALSNAIQLYYDHLQKDAAIFPSFNSFYDYLKNEYVPILREHNVRDKDFDIDNFLYVLRPYYAGGEFDYLLNSTENLNMLDQPFLVVEMDNVKDHPIIFPVIVLILMESFVSKMRKLKGVRKVLCVDEAWKAIAKSGMAEFLKYAFKTIRKFNGVPIVITQELDDLVNSPVIKDAIINNADIKILMDMRKFLHKFDKLQETLGLSEKAKTMLLSVNKDDREIFIDIGGQVQQVYRNELCVEEYLAFTTEGKERIKVLDFAQKHGSMEKGIAALSEEMKNKKGGV